MLSGRTAGSESAFDLVYFLERVFLFFFFSSRRRHTRYWHDWSSDVCSSDLAHLFDLVLGGAAAGRLEGRLAGGVLLHEIPHEAAGADILQHLLHLRLGLGRDDARAGDVLTVLGRRSEERRVGKECRSRWSPY